MSTHIAPYRGQERVFKIVFDIGKGPDGKRRRASELFRGTRTQAERHAHSLVAAVDKGRFVPVAARTFAQYVAGEWWPTRSPNLRATTQRGYTVILQRHILPIIGAVNLQKVEAAHIARILAALGDAGHRTQAQRTYRLLSTIYRAAVRSGAVGYNPVERVECPRPEYREMTALDPAQVNRILAEFGRRGSWALVPMTLAFTTGLRRGELAGLRWQDFDPAAGLLHVRRSIHFMPGGRMIVGSPKSRRSRRAVALDGRSVALLSEYRLKCEREAGMFGRTLTPECPMFAPATEYGLGLEARPWRTDSYTRTWRRMAVRLGIRARFHDARHTSASLMLAAGISARLVSERLGHATPSFTLAQYGHVMPGQQHEAAERLAVLLGGAAPALPASA